MLQWEFIWLLTHSIIFKWIFLPDVAVGAPYEDSGEGIVYIYRGSEKGLVETPMQVCVVVITSHWKFIFKLSSKMVLIVKL